MSRILVELHLNTDMINLLVGPLAEAKHVALRDNECFIKNLINVNALHNYGGISDLEKVYEYLKNFTSDNNLHEAKIAELFNKAFQFIDSPVHWKAITHLADYILINTKSTISIRPAGWIKLEKRGIHFTLVTSICCG